MSIQVREQTTFESKDNRFVINAFDAFYGLQVLTKLQDTVFAGFSAPPELVKDVIIRSCTVNGSMITDKNFDMVFAKKYKVMMDLFSEIIKFNFSDLMEGDDSPNAEGDTSEQ